MVRSMLFVKNLAGQRFGKLLVLSRNYDKEKKERRLKHGDKVYWNCLCDCGRVVVVDNSELLDKEYPVLCCKHCKRRIICRQNISNNIVFRLIRKLWRRNGSINNSK